MQRADKFTSIHIKVKQPIKGVKLITLPMKQFLQLFVKEKEEGCCCYFSLESCRDT